MEIRFCHDPETEQLHIHAHGVTEEEVGQVLMKPGDDFRGRRNTHIRFGQTANGHYLKVVYVPDKERNSILVITTHDLGGKDLKAFRRRQRRKRP